MARRMSGRGLRHEPQIRDFSCPCCGSIVTAPKQRCKTGPGHIKTMWCWNCREVRDFVQIRSGDYLDVLAASILQPACAGV